MTHFTNSRLCLIANHLVCLLWCRDRPSITSLRQRLFAAQDVYYLLLFGQSLAVSDQREVGLYNAYLSDRLVYQSSFKSLCCDSCDTGWVSSKCPTAEMTHYTSPRILIVSLSFIAGHLHRIPVFVSIFCQSAVSILSLSLLSYVKQIISLKRNKSRIKWWS